MKKSIAIIALAASVFSMQAAKAQLSISINIGSQPKRVLVQNSQPTFYYLPDADCYYDLAKQSYVYNNNGSWRYDKKAPSRYKNFDLRTARKINISNDAAPYSHHSDYRGKYGVPQKQYSSHVNKNGRNDRRDGNKYDKNKNQGRNQVRGRN